VLKRKEEVATEAEADLEVELKAGLQVNLKADLEAQLGDDPTLYNSQLEPGWLKFQIHWRV
jgi:hypothetical protein